MTPLAAPHAEILVAPVGRTASTPRRWDPRLYQIATLGGLLGYGVLWMGLDGDPWTAAIILVTVLATQLVATRVTGRGRFDPRSALISSLSLCLLLRTNSPERESLRARAEQEAATLASLTGWPIEDIRRRIGPVGGESSTPDGRKWWRKLFGE